jgi:polysaccharide export outer membrane protein
VTVQPDGKIVFPVVGEVTASGTTVQQLTEDLERGLRSQLKRPHVTISLKEMNQGLLRRASVLGAVKTPGSYELKERSTVIELLATAGGPTPVADLRHVTVTRVDGNRKVVLDLQRATRDGDVTSDATLEPGDLIIVPEGLPRTVLVLGEVARPGSYELQGEMRLLDALSLAGGPTPKADLRRVTLTHGGQAAGTKVDLESLLTEGQQAAQTANVVLEPGDTLVLPESERKYYVFGQVHKPEAYPLKPTDRVLDAIARAGGATQNADLGKVMLIRKDEKGEPVSQRVDLRRMMKKGDLACNESLRQGDVLFVPDRKQTTPLTDYFQFLWPISSVFSLLRR